MKRKQTSVRERKGVRASFERVLPLEARICYVDGLVSQIRELIDKGESISGFLEENEEIWKSNKKRFKALLTDVYETNLQLGFDNFHAMEELRNFLVKGDESLDIHLKGLEEEKAPNYRNFLAMRVEEREAYEQEFKEREADCRSLLPKLGWKEEEIDLFLKQYRANNELPPSKSEIIENASSLRMDDIVRAKARRAERRLREAGIPLDY